MYRMDWAVELSQEGRHLRKSDITGEVQIRSLNGPRRICSFVDDDDDGEQITGVVITPRFAMNAVERLGSRAVRPGLIAYLVRGSSCCMDRVSV